MSDRFCLHEVGLQQPTFLGHPPKHTPKNEDSGGDINSEGVVVIVIRVKRLSLNHHSLGHDTTTTTRREPQAPSWYDPMTTARP